MAAQIELEAVGHAQIARPSSSPPATTKTRFAESNVLSSNSNPPQPDIEQSTSHIQKALVTFHICAINFAWNATKGLTTVGLPRMTQDLNLPESLAFWPSSVPGLATASTLLLAGAVGDVMGPKYVNLAGCILNGFFMIGCGLSRTGIHLVVFRALGGVAIALHLSSSVALVSKLHKPGKSKNFSFACLGMSQVLGFSFGLVIGGILVDRSGWRSGWFLYAAIMLTVSAVGFWSLPNESARRSWQALRRELSIKVDWTGALLASAFMALVSYFLAIISADIHRAKDADSIVILCLGVLALPLFVAWMRRQVRAGKPALIPNAMWRNVAFTSICAATSLSFAVLNSLELFASLFFQDIQALSPLQAALRIIPSVVVGVALNFTTGMVVHKVPVAWLVVIVSLLSSGSPLLMATIQVEWPYWTSAFFAQVFMPFSVDVLLTVGLIIVTAAFPVDKQAIAGAVFNTAAQFGTSLGLAIMQVISAIVRANKSSLRPSEALLEGYRASFWTMFAFMISCALIGGVGLRKTGKIGLKQE